VGKAIREGLQWKTQKRKVVHYMPDWARRVPLSMMGASAAEGWGKKDVEKGGGGSEYREGAET